MPSETPSSASIRKLSAILFADIQGYTALMQKDEKEGRKTLEKFRNTLNQKVSDHKGQIVNDLGDGCLCTFDSAVDAMHCAKEAQLSFISEPNIPVRIGVHSGDVFYEANNVYGDSVNIASRIESLGVAGSVLFSKRVRQHIDNQPDFKIESLGEFDFKNVNKTMQVYALSNDGLVVPKREEMQGKGKAVTKSFNRLWYVLISLLLLFSALGLYQWQMSPSTPKISADILSERIAVLPFKNNTNDADLEILGDMSADWINRGLMEIENIEVASPFTVRSNIGALGIAPNDPQGRKSFSELTGAQNMLSGNYYEQNGDIIFQLQIESATDGKIRFIFDPIRGPKDDKEALLTQLGSQVAGYWVAREMVDSKNITAPKYEAYVAYQNALKKIDSGIEFAKVFELDSTFYLARLHFINGNRYGLIGNNIAHFHFLERHASKLSSYEAVWLNFLKGLYLGDAQQAYESLNELRKKYPKDFMINHETAAVVDDAFNNPGLVLEIYNELPIEEVDATSVGVYYTFRILHQVQSFIKLEQYSNLSTFVNTIKVAPRTINSAYIGALLTKALVENDPNEIDKAYLQLLKVYEYDKFSFFFTYLAFLNSTKGSPIRDRMRRDFYSNYLKLDPTDINKTLFKPFIVLIDGKSEKMPLDEIIKLPKVIAISTLSVEAVISLNNGDNKKAQLLTNKLLEYTSTGFDVTSQFGAGLTHYNIGKIYVKMGKLDLAIDHLKESRKLGLLVGLSSYKYDLDLASLVGIPEFDALTDPIWPEIKD